MSVSSTNRMINSPWIRKKKFEGLIIDKECKLRRRAKGFKKKRIAENNFRLTTCTQCKRYMDYFLGEKQIENNRLNAPICIPCITGIKRKEYVKNK